MISVVLRLECIGGKVPGIPSRAWCAWWRPSGYDFLQPKIDYSQSNSVGTRGVYKTYFLQDGMIYYISSPQSWGRTDKYYALVQDGEFIKLTKEEAWILVKHQSELVF